MVLSGSEGLVRDYFGTFSPNAAGSMAFHWRQVQWCAERQAVVGMHGNSGYLFELTLPAMPVGSEENAAEAAPQRERLSKSRHAQDQAQAPPRSPPAQSGNRSSLRLTSRRGSSTAARARDEESWSATCAGLTRRAADDKPRVRRHVLR